MTPDYKTALIIRLVTCITERWVVRIELVDNQTATYRFNLIVNIQQHDMSVTNLEWIRWIMIVTGLLATLYIVMCVGVLGEHSGRVFIRRVIKIPPLENRHSSHTQVFNPRVVC